MATPTPTPRPFFLQCGRIAMKSEVIHTKPLSIEEAKALYISDLKTALEERGAPVDGKKPVLLARLIQLIKEENVTTLIANSSSHSSSGDGIRETEDAIITSLSSSDGFVVRNVRERSKVVGDYMHSARKEDPANVNVHYDEQSLAVQIATDKRKKEEKDKKLGQAIAATLHIANFPLDFSQDKLEQLFDEHQVPNTLSIDYVKGMDRNNGGFKYFAFARFKSADDANTALSIIDKISFDGIKLKVDHYMPKGVRMAKQSYIVADNCVFLKNIHYTVNKQTLMKVCEERLGKNFIVASRLNNFPTDRLGCAYLYTKSAVDALHAVRILDGITDLSPAAIDSTSNTVGAAREGEGNRPVIAVRAELHHQSKEIINRKMESLMRAKGRALPSEHSLVLLNLAYELTADMIKEMVSSTGTGSYVSWLQNKLLPAAGAGE